jgi:formamidopyrimidine-DNA glycosylase
MPELPEVETIARDLRGLVTGSRILDARSNWAATLRSHELAAFRTAISGREIDGVGRRGKQLLVWLGPVDRSVGRADASSAAGALGVELAVAHVGAPAVAPATPAPATPAFAPATPAPATPAFAPATPAPATPAFAPATPAPDEPVVMTVHLKMTGQLFVVPAGTPEDRHIHLVLVLGDGRELRFRDMRKFGRIGLYRRDGATGLPVEGEAVGVLATGAEPLADEFTAARFAAMLARRRGRLKTLLLNQDFLAGVGNIYADESLWGARLHPLRDAHTVRPAEARRLHQALRDVLAEAVERRGSSVDDYTAPDGDGSMQEHLAVYQRAGEPCLRCSRPLRRIVVGGRSTHFCGWCQRLPAGHKAAAGSGSSGASYASDASVSTAKPGAAIAPRRGPRWSELSGEGALGRTAEEERVAADRAAERARRVAATRKAAATRRAAARAGGPA